MFSQEENTVITDSTKVETLDEVILTGQISPQSVDKSVFEVEVVSRRDIDLRAGNNLGDLLNQSLNLNILPNTSNGKSGVSLFGLDSQYVKVLIDNIPVINEDGFGNNIDLTLINLDDVERVEIVEGAMGVQYGANAVSGIINIITKKSSRHKTRVSLLSQEETVGSEYEWFDKGRHIQSVSLSHNFNDNFFASVNYFRNDFGGYWNGREGRVYDVNNGLRGHSWLPKEAHNPKLTLAYNTDKFKAFYKFDYLNERIDDYNPLVDENENTATATSNPFSLDNIYRNNRYIHSLNASGNLTDTLTYDVSVSYQEQNKDFERFTYYIRPETKENVFKSEFLTRSVFFSRGTLGNLFKSKKFNMQAGYELTNMKGKGSPYSSLIGNFENDFVTQRLDNYDVFATSEINLTNTWVVRPGARVSFSNQFSPQYMVELSNLFKLKNGYELRTISGASNRTPSYTELYTYFVDVNHNVQGNTRLKPEQGLSVFGHLKKTFNLNNNARLKSKLSASYLDLKNRIELIDISFNPLRSQYNNIDKYRMMGLFFNNSYQQGRFRGQLGLSVQGISQILDSSVNSNDDFLYNFQLNSNVTYTFPKINTSATVYFKYLGKEPRFVQKENDQGEQTYEQGFRDAFSWLDVTLRTSFANNAFVVTAGARNILDVDNINTTATNGGAHSDAPRSVALAYGRSFFLRLNYNLNL